MGTSYLAVQKFGKGITMRKYMQPMRGLCQYWIAYLRCHLKKSCPNKGNRNMVHEDVAIFQDIWETTNQCKVNLHFKLLGDISTVERTYTWVG
jgi:hypothetical protein